VIPVKEKNVKNCINQAKSCLFIEEKSLESQEESKLDGKQLYLNPS
jgi:hypothetical protein